MQIGKQESRILTNYCLGLAISDIVEFTSAEIVGPVRPRHNTLGTDMRMDLNKYSSVQCLSWTNHSIYTIRSHTWYHTLYEVANLQGFLSWQISSRYSSPAMITRDDRPIDNLGRFRRTDIQSQLSHVTQIHHLHADAPPQPLIQLEAFRVDASAHRVRDIGIHATQHQGVAADALAAVEGSCVFRETY